MTQQATTQPQYKTPPQDKGATELIQEGQRLQRENVKKMTLAEMLDYRQRLHAWKQRVREALE